MKRGKDDEKIMGPMFPRLHVNDTEKGGPRAPPRNKMALYEQLSIPSQRFNSGVLPLNSNNSANSVPSTTSSLRSGLERNILFPLHLPSSMPSHLAEKFHARHSDGVNLSNPLAQLEQRKKVGDEDDFMVPVFVHSGMGQCHSKCQNGRDSEKLTPFSPSYSNHSIKLQDVGDKDPKRTSSAGLNLRQEARSQSENNPKECLPNRDHSVQSATNLSTREKMNGTLKEANASPNPKDCDHRDANLSRLHDSDPCLQPIPLAEDTVCHTSVDEQMRDIEKGNVMRQRSNSRSGEIHSSPSETDNDTEYPGDRTLGSLQTRNMDKGDDVSETSIVDSILGLDISPDDVVGIIGQKHFWKARRAIVNQQRVFGFQVFELHRLIKVQRLIAESPHLLHEDGVFLKPSVKGSPVKKFPAEYVVKPLPDIVKSRDESEKPTHKMECSAENAVGKTSLSTMKKGSHPSNYGTYFGNPPPNWCYPSPGQQWLLPVMSPSEGLVYKPYPVPGFTGTGYGRCGPAGPIPMAGNFMNPSYGVPGHHHNQGIGFGHSYFPPYGTLVNPAVSGSAVEQMNWFAGPGSHGQTGQLLEGGANCSIQRQSSCNVPTKNSGAVPEVVKFPAFKDSELQGSTASSPSERERGVGGVARTAEGRDALQLFPVAPDEAETEQQRTRVIKVVPHNPRSATESAARIFQSIQKERKQHDSI